MVTGKLDQKWETYCRILEQTRPVWFVIWNQMDGRVNDLKLTEVDGWIGAEPKNKKRKMRRITLVEPKEMETDEESEEERRRVMNQSLVDKHMRKPGKPSIDEHEGKGSEDEVQAFNPKPPEKEENLNEWEEEDEILLSQLQKQLRERER